MLKDFSKGFSDREGDITKLNVKPTSIDFIPTLEFLKRDYDTIIDRVSEFEDMVTKYKGILDEKDKKIRKLWEENEELKSVQVEYLLQIEKMKEDLQNKTTSITTNENYAISSREKTRVLADNIEKFNKMMESMMKNADNAKSNLLPFMIKKTTCLALQILQRENFELMEGKEKVESNEL